VSTQEFKNDNLTVSLTREPGAKIKLQVFVLPQATNAAYIKAVKNVNKEVTLPGFRKGKAPEALILQHYKKHIDQEWNDVLLNTAFREAMALTNVHPWNQNSVKNPKIQHINRETGALFSIEFEAAPNVPKVDASQISLKAVKKDTVTDTRIANALEEVRLQNAEWEDVTDRSVDEGDYVDLDIESLDTPGHMICQDTRFDVATGKMGTWLRELLVGKNVHDTFEGTSEKEPCADACDDPSHNHGDGDFIQTRCKITVKALKKPKLPELDDELAKKVGADNVNLLKERITTVLEQQAEEQMNQKLKTQLDDALADKYQFDIPNSIIQNEKYHRLTERLAHLKPEEDTEERKQEIEKEITNEVERIYRVYFLIQQFAQDNKFDVTQDEIMREFMVQAYMNQGQGIIDPQMEGKEIHSKLYSYLLTKKAKDAMIQQANKI